MPSDKTIRVYFFRTEKYPIQDFKKMFNLLTTFAGKADFVLIKNHEVWDSKKPYRDNMVAMDMDEMGFYADPISSHLHHFPFEKGRLELGIEPTDFVVLLTEERLDKNCFSTYNLDRNIVVRAANWKEYTDIEPVLPVATIITDCIIKILLDLTYEPSEYSYDLLAPIKNSRQQEFSVESAIPWNLVDCLFQRKIEVAPFNFELRASDKKLRAAIESMLRLTGRKLPKEINLESDVVEMAESFAKILERAIYRDTENRAAKSSGKNLQNGKEPELTKEEQKQQKLIDIWEPTMNRYYTPIMGKLQLHSINGINCLTKKKGEYYWEKSLGRGTKTHLVAFYKECQRAGMLDGTKYEGSQAVVRDILRNTFNITINANDAFTLLKNDARKNSYLLPFRKLISETVKEIG